MIHLPVGTTRVPGKENKGSAAIEAAVALPILLVFLLGIFEFSNALRYQAAYNDAVSVGARYATLSPTPSTNAVRSQILSSSSVSLTNATVSVTSGTSATGRTYYTVAIAATYQPTIPFIKVPGIALTASKRAYVG